MPYVFLGINPHIDAAAVAMGFDPTDAADPRMLLVSEARSNRLMTKLADAIGQASAAKPEHAPAGAAHAVARLWMLRVMVEAIESALLELHTARELDTTELMKVIEYGAGHGSSNGDHRVGHDVGAAQDGRGSGRPRQPRGGERREG